jgi:SAM-dependent methyltransferase
MDLRQLTQRIKRRIAPFYYEAVYELITPRRVNTMNLGYAPVSAGLQQCYPSADQGLQYELYWQTFNQLDQPLERHQVVCELSSGRGGGLAFLRNLTAARVMGLECSNAARRYARKHFQLDTREARLPRLPLPDASVDVFLSVEAAHNYHNDVFIAEMRRCLKPGGMVCLTDMNLGPDDQVRQKLTNFYARAGLTIDRWRDIRPGVLRALAQDDARKREFMRFLPWPLRAEAEYYMCLVGSEKHHEMLRDERAYFVLRAVQAAA